MRIARSFIIAFSMYSQIPMPQFEWREEDMRYTLVFFPWIGAIAGVLVYLWRILCERFEIGIFCYVLMGAAIPLVLTGGIHLDGFMDTMDAFHSYRTREKKLEILRDPHLGAFSVIMLVTYGLIYLGAFSEIQDDRALRVFCAGFFLSRCLSGIGVVSFQPAKKDGLLYTFAGSADKKIVKSALYLQAFICIGFMMLQSVCAGGIAAAAALCTLAYYYCRCKKELGGITGDTAGYFVVVCEGSMAAAVAILNILF